MSRVGQNHKVVDAIVQGVTIYMMDMFRRKQFSPHVLLHHQAMHTYSLPLWSLCPSIARRGFSPGRAKPILLTIRTKMHFCQTRTRAVGSLFCSCLNDIKGFLTHWTNKKYSQTSSVWVFLGSSVGLHMARTAAVNAIRAMRNEDFRTVRTSFTKWHSYDSGYSTE